MNLFPLLLLLLMTVIPPCVAFGAAPDEATLARMTASPHFKDGQFVNEDPTTLMKASSWESAKHWLGGDEMRVPTCPLPIVTDAAGRRLRKRARLLVHQRDASPGASRRARPRDFDLGDAGGVQDDGRGRDAGEVNAVGARRGCRTARPRSGHCQPRSPNSGHQ